MKKRLLCLCAATLLLSLAAVSQQTRTLEVQPNYTGSGTVDKSHKMFAILWDSPDFTQGSAMPISIKAVSSKDEAVTFSDVQKVPAYVSVAYDPTGSWDGESGPPPAGTSLGMYSKEPGVPAPIDIAPGKTVKIKVTFDDSIKMK